MKTSRWRDLLMRTCLVALVLYASGCASTSRPLAGSPLSLKPDETRIAKAMAHYAQALIFEGIDGQNSLRALEHFRRAAALDPGNHRLYAKLATSALINSMPDQAIEALKRSCKILPDSVLAKTDLATAYRFIGETDLAIKCFKDAVKIAPERALLHRALVDLYLETDQFDEALRVMDKGMQSSDDPEQIRSLCYNRGLTEIEEGRSDRSMQCFRLVVKHSSSDHGQLYHLMGRLFEGMHLQKEAIEFFKLACTSDPPLPLSFIRLAQIRAQQDPRAAIETLREGNLALPGNILILLALGQVHSSQQQYGEAIGIFEKTAVIVAESDELEFNDTFYLQYGAACERAGLFSKAEELFTACINEYPKSHKVLNYLAYMWAEKGMKLDEALSYVNRALDVEPKNGAYLDTRGWIYYRKGDYPKALKHIQEANTLMPRDPTVNEHLGDAWSAIGDRDQAVLHWQKSYQIDSHNRQVADKLEANGVDPTSALDQPETADPITAE
jgi:tetratricopeptide (TPR) repeat protein